MSIDKQKLQSLLWSEVAAWKADCAEWKCNTMALQEFLGEKTVEEVALELLAENNRLGQIEYALSEWIGKTDWVQSSVQPLELGLHRADVLRTRIDQLRAENDALRDGANFRAIQSLRQDCEVLRKDAERYRWLRENAQQDVDGWGNELPVLVHAMGHTPEWKSRIDQSIDAGMTAAVQP